MLEIPGSSSTVYSGFCAQERHGETCRKRMGTGRMYTGGFAGGGTRESGKKFWKHWSMIPILNG